jgi:hypothetical protein
VPRSLCAFPKLSHEDSGGGPDPSVFPPINASPPALKGTYGSLRDQWDSKASVSYGSASLPLFVLPSQVRVESRAAEYIKKKRHCSKETG